MRRSRKRSSPGPAAEISADELLVLAAEGNDRRLEQLRQRVAAGEPAPYAAGFFFFRQRRFRIDSRAHITNPELTHLVDTVASLGGALERIGRRSLNVLEFGIGAGTLAITLKVEHPHWNLSGLDVDPDALDVAGENIRLHHVHVALLHSDYFSSWPAGAEPPDVIFGDPPSSSTQDLVAAERDRAFALRFPERWGIPRGASRTAVHDELIARVKALGWPSLLVLNYGALPRSVILNSAAPLRRRALLKPTPHCTILSGIAT